MVRVHSFVQELHILQAQPKKNHKVISPHASIKMAIIKKTTNNKCWQRRREKEPSCTAAENVNCYSRYEKQYEE